MSELGAYARRCMWLLAVVQADFAAVPLEWLVEKKTIHRSWRLYRRWGFDAVVHDQMMAGGCWPGRHVRSRTRIQTDSAVLSTWRLARIGNWRTEKCGPGKGETRVCVSQSDYVMSGSMGENPMFGVTMDEENVQPLIFEDDGLCLSNAISPNLRLRNLAWHVSRRKLGATFADRAQSAQSSCWGKIDSPRCWINTRNYAVAHESRPALY